MYFASGGTKNAVTAAAKNATENTVYFLKNSTTATKEQPLFTGI